MEFLPSDPSLWPWPALLGALCTGLFFGFLFGGRRRKVSRIERVADPAAPLRAELDTAHRTRADLQRQLDEARAGRAQAEAELAAVRADTRRLQPPTAHHPHDDLSRAAQRPTADAVAGDAPAGGAAGDLPLTRLKGVGPKLGTMLEGSGIATVGQLAALSDQEAADLDTRLGDFSGRLSRDRVVEQARLLAEGRNAEYTARFGAL